MPRKQPKVEEIKDSEELVAEQEMEEEERSRFFELTRKILLAPIGAVGLAQDETEKFVKRLVKRGEIAEKDARKLTRELDARRQQRAKKGFGKQMNNLVPPSKADIDKLYEMISELSAKIDKLEKEKTAV